MFVKHTILFMILLSLVGFIHAQETPVIPSDTTAIESYDMPGYFLVCTTSSGAVQLVLEGDKISEGQWNIVDGLTGIDTVSLMPEALPDHYMRHRGFVFYCDYFSDDSLYLNDATFIIEPGLADPACVSFRSVNYSNRYLQHNTSNPAGLVLQTVESGNEGRATFKFPDENINYPQPPDGNVDIPIEAVVLRWPVVEQAQMYAVYFGTSFNDVNAADLSESYGTLLDFQIQKNFYALNKLDKKQTYYWRVDTLINGTQDMVRGQVWRFTTINSLILEDFESYTDDMEAGKAIFQTWIDGWGNPYNGSIAGHLESPFAERSIVYKGKQSMPLWYDNISGFAWIDFSWDDFWDWLIQLGYEEPNAITSEATRYFDEPMDWILEESEYHYLVLNVRGKSENTGGNLYVKVNDAAIWNSDPNILTKPLWQQWVIDFNEIAADLNDVQSLAIGIDGYHNGIIYIDEIALYENPPNSIKPLDTITKDLAAWYTMDSNVMDNSGKGLDGYISGNPAYINGVKGMSLAFDGSDDYVTLPIGNVIAQSQDMTITCWVNFSNQGGAWQRIFDFGSGTLINMFLTPRTGTSGPMRFAMRTASVGEQQLTASETLPSDWHHVIVVIRGSNGTMDMYLDGQNVASGTTQLAPEDLGVTTQNWLGRSQYSSDAYLNGILDDFRIYTRSLTEPEIQYLASGK